MIEGIVGLLFFFVPSLIAMYRKHLNSKPIFIVNLTLGWTVIGWLVAFAWAFSDNVEKN